jgi:tetratricopeptide (TPR) repeat protein
MGNTHQDSLEIGIAITQHCNLNCYSCWHYSQFAPQWFINLNDLENDYKQIKKLFLGSRGGGGGVPIGLNGGEPLLHPDLLKIVILTRKYFDEDTIKLFTNGILLAKQEDVFWETCHKCEIIVGISPYPVDIQLEKIEEKARKYEVKIGNVLYHNYNDADGRKSHQETKALDMEGRSDPLYEWQHCGMQHCGVRLSNTVKLREGKLYQCPTVAYIDLMNKALNVDYKVCEDDYIDIYKAKSARDIFDFLSKPFPFCRYCHNEKGKNIAWRQSLRHIVEYADWETYAERRIESGDYDSAIQLAQDILKYAAPDHAGQWAYRILAECYEHKGDIVTAEREAGNWVCAEPSRARPRELQARLLRDLGELDQAKGLALDYLEKHSERTGWAYRELSYVYEAKGEREQALEAGKKALEIHPDHAEFRQWFSRLDS